ncbi:gas vesicle protein GvpG [Aminithiophilus ramosus]|uniref:Gas vesicle protein GvpG n=2 Tax=Synergistales TaxID=649776 RepID=A0A9Q7EX92_9BACT|nr:hypothetical protein [Aminithiophilus ramosus]QTX32275.1 gas vesicle protein GvpG [Aminithiophilus ramosus]QVL36142.1 gas vesicle protein GvpG [Synergistota bacterium]HCU22334.1 hypothetical protein [Candidatus Atribacteria bacterium]
MLGLIKDIFIGIPVILSKEIILAIKKEIDKEGLMTEDAIRARLKEIQKSLEDGNLSENEYDELENDLIERLKKIKAER